jgi:hypothetical protein
MGMSQGNFSSGPEGLQLKAWALINPSTGAIVKGLGFSGVVRNAAGDWTFTFSAAAANTTYLIDAKINQISISGGPDVVVIPTVNKLVGAFRLQNGRYTPGVGSSFDDGNAVHVAVYG